MSLGPLFQRGISAEVPSGNSLTYRVFGRKKEFLHSPRHNTAVDESECERGASDREHHSGESLQVKWGDDRETEETRHEDKQRSPDPSTPPVQVLVPLSLFTGHVFANVGDNWDLKRPKQRKERIGHRLHGGNGSLSGMRLRAGQVALRTLQSEHGRPSRSEGKPNGRKATRSEQRIASSRLGDSAQGAGQQVTHFCSWGAPLRGACCNCNQR